MAHDYNPEWDYDLVEPSGDDAAIVHQAVTEIKADIEP